MLVLKLDMLGKLFWKFKNRLGDVVPAFFGHPGFPERKSDIKGWWPRTLVASQFPVLGVLSSWDVGKLERRCEISAG